MGGINSACLKPRPVCNSASPSIAAEENEKSSSEMKQPSLVDEVTTSMTTTMTKGTMNSGIPATEARRDKSKKKSKKRELSHAFHLHGFQSQDKVSSEGRLPECHPNFDR